MDASREGPDGLAAGGERALVTAAPLGLTPAAPRSDLRAELQASLGDAYTIERELGGGGMSRVFVAQDTALRRRVALKVLPHELAGEISGERFRREILLSAQLQHPHVVPVLSAGETAGGVPYFTMPFVEGESLRARLAAHGPLPVAEAVAMLRDVARALAYAHERGVVHRDIKPDNVLLAHGGAALVADFGVAKALAQALVSTRTGGDGGSVDAAGATLTRTGTSLGTPTYMAPEQIAADSTADHRVDLYALGATAYEALTGAAPFAGLPPQQQLVAQMTAAPAPVTALRPDVPPALAALVAQCLEKDPGARPASAAAVVAALDALAGSGVHGAVDPLATRGTLVRALGLYVAAFVLVAGLARVAMIGLALPDWVFPGALIVMALGLPAILVTALLHHRTRAARGRHGPVASGATPAEGRLAIRVGRQLSWRRVAAVGGATLAVFALLVAGYMASRVVGLGPGASLLSAGVLETRGRVLVSEFASAPADTSVAAVATEAFRTDLAQSAVVTLPSSSALREALQRMQRPPTTVLRGELARELAAREGIRVVVEGDVRALGGGYVLSTRLVAPATGEVLAAYRETAEGPSEIVGAIDRLSKRARARIGESYRSVRAAPALERVTTASFPALEKYTQAMAAERRGEETPRVIDRLREAVAIDSTFAMAYAQMCCLGRLPPSQAIELGQRAMRYRDRLPPAERYEVEIVQYMLENDMERLIASARNALELDSLNRRALRSLGVAHGRRREFAEAERYFARNLAADSAQGQRPAPEAFGALARVQFQQGKEAEARRTLERGRALHAARVGPVPGRLIELEVATGHYDEAERRLRDALAAAPPSGDLRAAIGSQALVMALLRGRLGEAFRALDSLAEGHARNGRHAPALGTRLERLLATADHLGDSAAARRGLAEALRRHPLDSMPAVDRPYEAMARLQARLGDVAAAAATLREYERVAQPAVGRRNEGAMGRYAATRAFVASQQGDYPRALALAREADVGNCPACPLYLIGRIHDRAGVLDSARAQYERYLSLPNMERLYQGAQFARAHERLGQLYEQAGDRARAAAHHAAFVELWKNADPALQPRVRAARDALSRLRAAG